MDLFAADFRLKDPWALALLALVVLGLVASVRRERRSGGGLLFSSLGLLPPAATPWRVRLFPALLVLRVCAAALLVAALARPQTTQAATAVASEGIDIVLVLDVSSSMTTADFGGATKIDASKRVMLEFLRGLKNDRVGLVAFSGDAAIMSPLTFDYTALQRLVEPIEAGGALGGGTAIGTGIATGVNVLRDSQALSKVVVLLTDGENNSGEIGPLDAAQLGRLLGVKVYTIGAVRADVSRIDVDEQLMRRISELTGARYFRAADEDTLLGVYREISSLEKTKVGSRDEAEQEERNLVFLAAGAALLLLELLLAATLLRRVP